MSSESHDVAIRVAEAAMGEGEGASEGAGRVWIVRPKPIRLGPRPQPSQPSQPIAGTEALRNDGRGGGETREEEEVGKPYNEDPTRVPELLLQSLNLQVRGVQRVMAMYGATPYDQLSLVYGRPTIIVVWHPLQAASRILTSLILDALATNPTTNLVAADVTQTHFPSWHASTVRCNEVPRIELYDASGAFVTVLWGPLVPLMEALRDVDAWTRVTIDASVASSLSSEVSFPSLRRGVRPANDKRQPQSGGGGGGVAWPRP